jgi:2-methylcitrate dehydratase PrpD
MADNQEPTLAFAEDIRRIGRETLPAPDVEQVRRLVLDLLGVSIFGATMPWTKALALWAAEFSGGGPAPVISAGFRATPQVAALVNGSAGHGYELDDTHNASMSHPGAVIIPAVLSAAAGSGATAMQVFAAVAAGYEAMGRIGMACNAHAVISRGFHPTSLFGAFGAAAGVGALDGFDAATLACAWGHALSLTGGSMQFSDEPAGTTVKRLHAGYGAQHGLLAAGMARAGIAAPTRSLDGKYGLFALYGSGADAEQLRRPSGAPLQIHDISMKPYSCCRLFHSLIDALEEASETFSIPLDHIERIRVRAPEVVFDQHMLRRPRSVMAAQYSLPYVVGATLAYGSRRFDVYQESFFDDPKILALADKVEGTRDLDIEKDYPARMGAAVELYVRNGVRREAQVMDSRGTPARPLATDAIEAKGQALIDSAGLRFNMAAARRTLWTASDGQAIVELFAA